MQKKESAYLDYLHRRALESGIQNGSIDKMTQCQDLLGKAITVRPWDERNSEVYYAGAEHRVYSAEPGNRQLRNTLIGLRMAEWLIAVAPGSTVVEFGTGRAPAYNGLLWQHIRRVVAVDPVPKEVHRGIAEGRLPQTTEIISARTPPYHTLGDGEAALVASLSTTHVLPHRELLTLMPELYRLLAPGGSFVSVMDTDASPRFFEGMDSRMAELITAQIEQKRGVVHPGTLTGLLEYGAGVETELTGVETRVHYPRQGGRAETVSYSQFSYAGRPFPASLLSPEILVQVPYMLDTLAAHFSATTPAPAVLKSCEGLMQFLASDTGASIGRLMEPVRRLGILTNSVLAQGDNEYIHVLNLLSAYLAEQIMQDMHTAQLELIANQCGFSRCGSTRRAVTIAGIGGMAPLFHEGITFPDSGTRSPALVYREFVAQK